jgi:3-oxoisoapionate decarboxylase
MKIGISSFTYGWNVGLPNHMPAVPLSEIDLINQTLSFGLSCLQIGDNLPIHLFDEVRKDNFRNAIKESNIRLEVGAKKLNEVELRKYLDITQYYDSRLLRFIIDGENYKPSIDDVASLLKEFLPELKRRNITLGIENHDRQTAKELMTLMDKVGDNHVGICLDCVNSMGAGEGFEYVAETLLPYTVNIHIKDFSISRLPSKMGFIIEGAIAGKGMTKLPWLFESLKKYDRCQSLILEQWVPLAPNIEETCVKERDWAEQSMKYIKEIINKNF